MPTRPASSRGRKGGRERGRKGEREEGRKGGREEGREGEREGGRERGKEGRREGRREGGEEGGREGGREGGSEGGSERWREGGKEEGRGRKEVRKAGQYTKACSSLTQLNIFVVSFPPPLSPSTLLTQGGDQIALPYCDLERVTVAFRKGGGKSLGREGGKKKKCAFF